MSPPEVPNRRDTQSQRRVHPDRTRNCDHDGNTPRQQGVFAHDGVLAPLYLHSCKAPSVGAQRHKGETLPCDAVNHATWATSHYCSPVTNLLSPDLGRKFQAVHFVIAGATRPEPDHHKASYRVQRDTLRRLSL